MNTPILTIAIPTFNRADYLRLNLHHLAPEVAGLKPGQVEVLVSDNCSDDETPEVVAQAIAAGLSIRSIRNSSNIGSDANIAQCFNEASGHYVQIMGDDDLFLEGQLAKLIHELQQKEYGMVCLRSYGYDNDHIKELPSTQGGRHEFHDVSSFLYEIGPLISFISACVINKRVQKEVDAQVYCGTNLVQINLVIQAMLLVQDNLYLKDYILACKRANSGGYDFSEVFVERFFNILDAYIPKGLPAQAVQDLGRKMLISYYPFSLLRLRLSRQGDLKAIYSRFNARFKGQKLFTLWVAPLIWLPRPLALLWGGVTVFVGRTIHGDLRRGVYFAVNRWLHRW